MSRRISTIGLTAIAVLTFGVAVTAQTNLTAKAGSFQPQPVSAIPETDRVRDGLVGPVRRVRTEIVKVSTQDGRLVEGKRSLLEIVAYDIKGNKTENQYFPLAGATLTGKEVYKYDDKGNISEMTMLNQDGTFLSKEVYKYEFDFAGNWNKMTTSVAVVDSGKVNFEPTEVTYRSIMYYLDENMVKMVQPPQPGVSQPAPVTNVAKSNVEPKPQPVAAAPSSGKSAKRTQSPSLPAANTSDTMYENNSSEVRTPTNNANPTAAAVVMDNEPPPSPAPKPILKPISGGVLNGIAVSLPAPVYPETAKRMRISGLVSVNVVVDETGKVIAAEVTSGPTPLRDSSVQAALRAKFSPTKLSGQPVKVSGIINYRFSLSQ